MSLPGLLVAVSILWLVACVAVFFAGVSIGRREIEKCPTAIVSGSLVAVCPLGRVDRPARPGPPV